MQLLILRSSHISLWTQDFDGPEVVWLTSMSGHLRPHTMSLALKSLDGQHLACSGKHFFQLGFDAHDVRKLVDMVLKFARDSLPPTQSPLPMEVKAGALVIHRAGTAWAIALSRQHRQCLRHDQRTWLDDALVSVHCLIPDQMWRSIPSDGYCGYVALWRVLSPTSSISNRANSLHREALKAFLSYLVPQIPADLIEALGRVMEAIACLSVPGMPPTSAWSQIDLIRHFLTPQSLPF